MDNLLETVVLWSLPGCLATLGGLASVFYKDAVSVKFTWYWFVGKLIMAFFVGTVMNQFLPPDLTGRSGWIMVGGFFAYPVMAAFETRIKPLVDTVKPGQS